MDMMSKLPSAIIENILCLIPIQEAARTSILSKEWRYHWTRIPKLEFNADSFRVSNYFSDVNIQGEREWMTYWCKLLYQILLKHEGPIHEFTLLIYLYDETCVELDDIIFYLSRNYNVNKLTLDLDVGYVLPLSHVSFDRLTDLHLCYCNLGYESTFNVFHSLTNLSLNDVSTSKETLLRLLSSCPLLKSLTMMISVYQDLANFTITNLFECIPMVENLSICISTITEFAEHGVPLVLSMPLIHLKYIYIDQMSFMCKYGLPFLLLLIRSSPNLEKLKLLVYGTYNYHEGIDDFDDQVLRSEKCSSAIQNCSNIWLEHLEVLEMNVLWTLNFSNKKHLLDFVMLILAKSPVLKKVSIYLSGRFHENEKLQVCEVLLASRCASLVAEISVEIKV